MSLDNKELYNYLHDLQQCEEKNKHTEYKKFHKMLATESNLNFHFTKELILLINQDMCEDADYTCEVMNTLLELLTKLESKNEILRLEMRPLLLKSALINIKLQNIWFLNESHNKTICKAKNIIYKIMIAYPEEVFIDLISHHLHHLYTIILEPLKAKCGVTAYYSSLLIKDVEDDTLIFEMIKKILKGVPLESKKKFIKNGLDIWFSSVVPYAISLMICNLLRKYPIFVEVIDMIVLELADVDYKSNSEWKKILECISNPSGYRTLLMKSLKSGSDNWHLIWCMLIKLLKTRTVTKDGPLNCILTVVESAFKSDTKNRCQAFHCWEVLAEHFAGDKNAEKRMAFLLIPLQSKNAKVEEVILAKFSCWWHIIKCFRKKINSGNSALLIKFLDFCFGDLNDVEYRQVKIKGAQAMHDIVGHNSECNGCNDPSFPRMTTPILDIALLTYNLSKWEHYLTCTYYVISECSEPEAANKQITCIWKSIFNLVSSMTKNHIRKEITIALLKATLDIVQTRNLTSYIANALCKIFLEGDVTKFIRLLECNENDDINNEPLSLLFKCFLHPSFNEQLFQKEVSINDLKPMIEFGVKACKSNIFFKWYLLQLTENDFYFWIALGNFVTKQNCFKEIAYDLLKWPMKVNALIKNLSLAVTLWDKMFDHSISILNIKQINELSEDLTSFKQCPVFSILGLLSICSHGLTDILSRKIETLIAINNTGRKYLLYNTFFPNLILFYDRLSCELSKDINVKKAINVIKTLNSLLIFFIKLHKESSSQEEKSIASVLKSLFNTINNILKVKEYANLNSYISETVKIYKISNIKMGLNILPINDNMDFCANDKICEPTKEPINPNSLKNKLNNTIKVVVENGENVVVVDSNNKFNPLKLTEHQRERLQRKRDDIPALYQDLSQSQDEFKKKYWTSLDKSSNNESSNKVDQICKNKILDKDLNKEHNSNNGCLRKQKIIITTPSPKSLKRLPFKDRITQNLNILLAKTKTNSESQSLEVNSSNLINENSKITNKVATLNRIIIPDKNQPTSNKTFYIVNESEKTNNKPQVHVKDLQEKDDSFKNSNNLFHIIHALEKTNDTGDNISEKKKIEDNSKVTPNKSEKNKLKDSHLFTMSMERPLRVKRKPKKFAIEYVDITKKRRVSLPNMPESNKSQFVSNKVLNSKINEESNDITFSKEKSLSENNDDIIEIDNDIIEIDNDIIEIVNNEDEDITQIQYELTDNGTLNCENAETVKKYINNVELKETQNFNDTDNVLHSQSEDNTQNLHNTQNIDDTQNIHSAQTVDNNQNVELTRQNTQNIHNIQTVDDSQNVEVYTVYQNLHSSQNIYQTQNVKDAKKENKDNKSLDRTQNVDYELILSDTHNDDDLQNIESEKIEHNMQAEEITETKKSSLSTSLNKSEGFNNSNIKTKNNKSEVKSSLKEKKPKQSRLVKSLAIDMVEGNPFLEKPTTRRTRRISDTPKKEKRRVKQTDIKIKSKDKTLITKKNSEQIIDSEVNNDISAEKNINEIPLSEDFIESSQDSMISTISVKTRRSFKRKSCTNSDHSADIPISDSKPTSVCNATIQTKDVSDLNFSELTATMDTEPLLTTPLTNENLTPIIEINCQDKTEVGPETQELAEADTEPVDPSLCCLEIDADNLDNTITVKVNSGTADITDISTSCLSSPFKDDAQRNEVFLNNTLDISPIKSMLPKKDDSPEKPDEFIVIKLTSPVQSNGEPLKDSPEMFTNDKLSPSNNELSPPRQVPTDGVTSPLSLKKSRTQIRPSGRAAQMLSLCHPDKLQSMIDKSSECEEPKKNCVAMSARRNLQILYNMNNDATANDKSEDKLENFLKLQRPLPSSDSSPIGPILKRKLTDIEDEITMSPASKKKRVSFHDPPVSTTVAVQKYIEISEKSPQHKRERPQRNNIKSPKQLDTLFKQTLAPIKCNDESMKDNEDSNSIDSTPLIEVVNVSELNDTEPICPDLINCMEPIEVIASELSSPAMKVLFVKELEGKINTVADFAKLTEVEVNRLCMKAPKVQVAKEVLANYLANKPDKTDTIEEVSEKMDSDVIELSPTKTFVDIDSQTIKTDVDEKYVQTNDKICSEILVQTMESSFVSTEDLITSCIKERPDFIENISDRKELQNSLKLDTLLPAIQNTVTSDVEKKKILNEVISKEEDLEALQEYLCDKFNSTSLVLFCSDLLKSVHQKLDK